MKSSLEALAFTVILIVIFTTLSVLAEAIFDYHLDTTQMMLCSIMYFLLLSLDRK